MDFIEQVRVSKEGAETAVGTEIDFSSPILCVRKIGRVGIAEDAPAQGDKLFLVVAFSSRVRHFKKTQFSVRRDTIPPRE